MRYFYSAIQKVMEILGQKKKGTRVYMFHHIYKQAEDVPAELEGVSISVEGFECFIDTLQKKKFAFLSIDEMLTYSDNNGVCITFDDAFFSAVENAIPLLLKEKIPFCVFVADKYVDAEGYIRSDQLEMLRQESLCTIGYHTKNHRLMRKLKERETLWELDSTDFSRKYGIAPRHFAFPYGSVYACARKATRQANIKYETVFSTIACNCTQKHIRKKQKFLPRINVNEKNYAKLTKQGTA